MRLQSFCLLFALCAAFGGFAAERPKQIFAHYMGCYPAGTGPTAHHRSELKLDHNSPAFGQATGGTVYNWDLVPHKTRLSPEASAELDIKRAIRGGIDGFSLDAWAGSAGAKATLDALFRAAEKSGSDFKITICLDPSCLPQHPEDSGDTRPHAYADAIKYLLERHGDSPNLARRNGKPLIFGYHSQGIAKAINTPEDRRKIADAYREVERLVGQPLYFHFCIGAFNWGVPSGKGASVEEAGAWAAEHFPAVGDFFDAYYPTDEILKAGRAVKAKGAEWSQPMWFQYYNRGNQSLYVEDGFNKLRRMWKNARDLDSTLLQFVTWNDYGEDTVLAPGYNTNYAVLAYNRYFIDWWKQGKPPAVDRDRIILSFRRFNEDAQIYPFHAREFAPGVIEVVTLLTAPGRVELPGRGIAYDAPAGMSFRQFPVTPGSVAATVARNGKKVVEVVAPEVITDRPFRPDNTMYAFSSDCDRYWEEDFPGVPPLHYSEYGDADGDGLPNWFEMYYFGRFGDFTTMTAADPEADPDGDDFTNLEEYRNQTDPLVAEKPYRAGDEWRRQDIFDAKTCANPERDFNDRAVWRYYYKHGKQGEIRNDGHYERTNSNLPNVPYTGGVLAHLSPSSAPGFRHLHGWIAFTPEGDTLFKPRREAAQILGWRSPVAGTVSVSGEILPDNGGQDGITLKIGTRTQSLFDKVIPPKTGLKFDLRQVRVQKGDEIFFFCDCSPGFDSDRLVIRNLVIKLDNLE